MTEEQFEEILNAILAGKYSWACVLILQVAGYNPLHYIPYRTYNRLIKDNRLSKNNSKSSVNKSDSSNNLKTKKIQDLSYIKEVKKEDSQIVGGNKSWVFYSCFK
jgi:hypothetical protein